MCSRETTFCDGVFEVFDAEGEGFSVHCFLGSVEVFWGSFSSVSMLTQVSRGLLVCD